MNMAAKLSVLFFMVALPIAVGGCQKKTSYPNCKNDSECRIDMNGKEINGVCYMGKCEECATDSDCTDLKQCVNHRCRAACHADADCGAGNHCENNFCMEDCMSDESCPAGHACVQSRCVAQAGAVDKNAWASADCQGLGAINFDFDRYEVKADYKDQIARLVKCLETNADYTVTIEGHTDDRGTPSYNMALGQKRADAVRTYLKTHWGIASNRVRTLSHGEQQPMVRENNEYAWQQNRRAEFVLAKN